MESDIAVLSAQLQDIILADQRFTARKHIEVDSQFLALGHDPVQILIGQVQAVAVLGRPASHAVQVAGAGGIHQDQPGNVAVIFFPVGTDRLCPVEHGLETEVQKGHLQHVRIQLIEQPVDIDIPFLIGIPDHPPDLIILLFREHVAHIFFCNINQVQHSSDPVLLHLPEHDIDALGKSQSGCHMRKIRHFISSCILSVPAVPSAAAGRRKTILPYPFPCP